MLDAAQDLVLRPLFKMLKEKMMESLLLQVGFLNMCSNLENWRWSWIFGWRYGMKIWDGLLMGIGSLMRGPQKWCYEDLVDVFGWGFRLLWGSYQWWLRFYCLKWYCGTTKGGRWGEPKRTCIVSSILCEIKSTDPLKQFNYKLFFSALLQPSNAYGHGGAGDRVLLLKSHLSIVN